MQQATHVTKAATITPEETVDALRAKCALLEASLKNSAAKGQEVVRNLAGDLDGLGVGYFNPLIGYTPTETCGNISDVMQTLYGVFKDREIDFHGAQPGLLLIIKTVWSAAQYTGNSNQECAA